MNAEQLEKYALLRGLNRGQAEKDYYQNLILFILYNKVSKELIFKGGTALSRCYGLNRFSEDLDFTVATDSDFISIVSDGLRDFGIRYKIKEGSSPKPSRKYKIKIEGPLFKGTEQSICSITIDFSLREKVLLEPNIVTIGYHMDIIPTFDVYVMKEEEILAEKIRAMMTRASARDLYDAVFLLRKGINPQMELINKKLEYYNLKFDKETFIHRPLLVKPIWKSELSYLVKNVPDFEEYVKEIESRF